MSPFRYFSSQPTSEKNVIFPTLLQLVTNCVCLTLSAGQVMYSVIIRAAICVWKQD